MRAWPTADLSDNIWYENFLKSAKDSYSENIYRKKKAKIYII